MAVIHLPSLGPVGDAVGRVPIPGGGGVTTGQVADAVTGIVGSKPGRAVTGKVDDDLAADDKVKNPDAREFLKSLGWPDAEIENAAAVVYRESRGKCDAKNHNTNGTWDKGLFQINDVWVKSGLISDEDRLDCNKGAKAALEIFHKSGWGPWYSSGCTGAPASCTPAPKGFKINGTTSSKDSLTGSVKDAVSSPLGAITKLIAQLFNADTWFRVGKVVLGGIVLVMAMEVFLNKSGASSAIMGTAATAAKFVK